MPTWSPGCDPRRPHQFAWEANPVKALRRRRREVGATPTPGTIFGGRTRVQVRLASRPRWVRSPRPPPSSFPGRSTVGRAAVTAQSWFESTPGSQSRGHFLTDQQTRLSREQCGFESRWPCQYPHVAQLDERGATNAVDAGSSPVVGSIFIRA